MTPLYPGARDDLRLAVHNVYNDHFNIQVRETFAWLLLPVILIISTFLSSPLYYSAKLESLESIMASHHPTPLHPI